MEGVLISARGGDELDVLMFQSPWNHSLVVIARLSLGLSRSYICRGGIAYPYEQRPLKATWNRLVKVLMRIKETHALFDNTCIVDINADLSQLEFI